VGDTSVLPTVDDATGANGVDSGAFDCCVSTTANTAAMPATATSDAGWMRCRVRSGTDERGALFVCAKTSDRNTSSGSPKLSRAVRRGSPPGSGANESIASDSVR